MKDGFQEVNYSAASKPPIFLWMLRYLVVVLVKTWWSWDHVCVTTGLFCLVSRVGWFLSETEMVRLRTAIPSHLSLRHRELGSSQLKLCHTQGIITTLPLGTNHPFSDQHHITSQSSHVWILSTILPMADLMVMKTKSPLCGNVWEFWPGGEQQRNL